MLTDFVNEAGKEKILTPFGLNLTPVSGNSVECYNLPLSVRQAYKDFYVKNPNSFGLDYCDSMHL